MTKVEEKYQQYQEARVTVGVRKEELRQLDQRVADAQAEVSRLEASRLAVNQRVANACAHFRTIAQELPALIASDCAGVAPKRATEVVEDPANNEAAAQ